jgi:hypothetical protein
MHFTRLDVVSTSIMRSRDNGVPPYKVLRATYDLPPRNWSTINRKMFSEKAEVSLSFQKKIHLAKVFVDYKYKKILSIKQNFLCCYILWVFL